MDKNKVEDTSNGKDNNEENITSEKEKELVRRKVLFSKIKRRILRHTWLVRIGILFSLVLGIVIVFSLTTVLIGKTSFGYYFTLANDFLFLPKDKIEIIDNRTNILILGKGGNGHEASELTDTIIFSSLNHKTKSLQLISLPRDIWNPELRAKLNSAYYWGNEKEENGGLKLAKSSVENIIGKPVEYGVVIDFTGFKEIVDTLGGIEINVENSFSDEKYPIPGKENDECGGDPEFKCRYETLSFEKGKQLIDGETALKFVRSRNAEGDEGTDFARAKRQQLVIQAIKKKLLRKEILFSPKKLMQLKEVAGKYIETDIDIEAVAILARRLLQAKDNIHSSVLPEDFLENPPKSAKYDYLYVFVPKVGDWSEVHEWTECILLEKECY